MTLKEILKQTDAMPSHHAMEATDGRGFSFDMRTRTIRIFQGAENPEDKKYIDLQFEDIRWLQRMIDAINRNTWSENQTENP